MTVWQDASARNCFSHCLLAGSNSIYKIIFIIIFYFAYSLGCKTVRIFCVFSRMYAHWLKCARKWKVRLGRAFALGQVSLARDNPRFRRCASREFALLPIRVSLNFKRKRRLFCRLLHSLNHSNPHHPGQTFITNKQKCKRQLKRKFPPLKMSDGVLAQQQGVVFQKRNSLQLLFFLILVLLVLLFPILESKNLRHRKQCQFFFFLSKWELFL